MNLVRRFPFKTILFVFCLAGVLYAGRGTLLPLVARPLIRDDGPCKAEAAVVLAGDAWGHRILKAAELAKAGYVPEVLVSGPVGMYGVHEDDLAIAFAVRMGYPAKLFVPLSHFATSTGEEAIVIVRELEQRKIHTFLLVTSDYHTARARRIFRATERALGGSFEMRVVASPDQDFRAGDWWRSRRAQKTVFLEWCKTIATALGV